jgi:hypothetical protein
MEQISLGGRPMRGFALSDCQGCGSAEADGFALGDAQTLACPECSWVAPFLGGMVATGVAFTVAAVYTFTNRRRA